jgi:hypothetical protein
MKNKVLLTTIGMAVLATFTLNVRAFDYVNADGIALSPRAKDNQIKVVLGYTAVQPAQPAAATGIALSQRAAANQIKVVPTVANDVNPALACRNMMTASPKAIEACSENAAMPGRRTTTTASAK